MKAVREYQIALQSTPRFNQVHGHVITGIDPYPESALVFSVIVSDCLCGAPFDLEATPNYKARIEEAGFTWPPPKRIDYPTKSW